MSQLPPTTADALRALNALVAAARPDTDVTGAAEVIAIHLSLRTSAPPTNTGLPCPYCREKLPSLEIGFGIDGNPLGANLRIGVRIAKEMGRDELRDLSLFLRKAADDGDLDDDEDDGGDGPPEGTA